MKILIVGAGGTLGHAVVAELGQRHEIVSAGRQSGDLRVDIADPASVRALFEKTGPLDAIVCAAGSVHFGPLDTFTEEQFARGINDKLMGQVRLVREGVAHLRDGGSFTLITGILTDQPIVQGVSASMVNGAVEAFVRAAAIELPRGIRINAVSPTILTESMGSYGPYFRGFEPVPAARAALAFSRSVEGAETGRVYKIH
ncbi:NAD(P)-dependent dehydrogenase (short-subunit alcohol dehydrogenase family) [Luteibacter rhizovicinus]|uniref:NAD(P)-dependent dehydrogenase (Short-subunit alcohol dehydrogenase family) n=1 Tax=Luteibacter rhizovicinus TaxID=242606 RepID=A0A4R3YJJ4_9GAMM|nr:short chain dehydrogenase [Luteibacter rhizovicinus]TCV92406.1 NAD(P)-dependent dehydrogenase (short-subunit alcohol dehydrogenase family) [Luteibacter rhizovicinus]